MQTKKEASAREALQERWQEFYDYRQATYRHLINGRSLSEKDVEAVFDKLLTGPLGYTPDQISRQPDYADYVLMSRDFKVAVAEAKGWERFRKRDNLVKALGQAANYADRHRVRNLIAFDGESVVLAVRGENEISILLDLKVDSPDPLDDLFYLTLYGLSKLPTEKLFTFEYLKANSSGDFKTHHGVSLPRSSFAYVGDIRNKSTWKMPYRNEDGTVDTSRIDKAVNYLLSPGGYRGVTVSDRSIPEAATPEAAKRLAKAYKEVGKWNGTNCKPVERLKAYLSIKGISEEEI